MSRAVLTILILVLSVNRTFSQNYNLGSWNILSAKYNYANNWSIFGEAQLRSLKFYSNFHYYEYKGGISFSAHKNVFLSLGVGSYQTYREGGDFVLPKNNDEIRLWPQVILFQSIGKFKIEHRYRAEFRFTSDGYRNRFRYRLGVSYLFGKERDDYSPFQLSASNELFFTDHEPYFERDRLLLAFNYKPSKALTLQVGFIHQLDYKINDETGRNFLVLGLYMEFSRFKSSGIPDNTEIKDN